MLTLVDSNTGIRVADDVVLESSTVGSGPSLVLLHGAEGVRANKAFIAELAKNFSVHAPSHPGFGLSPRPDWCDSIDDLAYLYLDWMEQQELKDVVLVGLQFGGWLASEIAVRNTSRISKLVLVDPVGIKISGREERDIADLFAMSRAELDSRLFALASSGPGNLAAVEEDVVFEIARNEEALALYGWQPFLHNPRLRRWLHRIQVPTEVVWGESDGIVSPEYGREFAASIPGARFELVSEAAHRSQIDQPVAIASLVAAFTR